MGHYLSLDSTLIVLYYTFITIWELSVYRKSDRVMLHHHFKSRSVRDAELKVSVPRVCSGLS